MQSKTLWLLFSLAWLAVFGVILPFLGWRSGWFTLMESLTAGTGLVILWYTFETHQVRREMVRQNEIAIQPVVIAIIEERSAATVPAPTFRQELILRNIGRGPALFLKVQDLTLTDPAGDRVRFMARFAPVGYLEPQHEAVVRVAECRAVDVDLPSTYLNPLPSLEQSTALEDYDVVIEYQDTNGEAWETLMRMGKTGISLLWHGKSREAPADQDRPYQASRANMK